MSDLYGLKRGIKQVTGSLSNSLNKITGWGGSKISQYKDKNDPSPKLVLLEVLSAYESTDCMTYYYGHIWSTKTIITWDFHVLYNGNPNF